MTKSWKYAPDNSRPTDESENFYQELQETIDKINTTHKIIVFGDLNAPVANAVIQNVKQICNESIINEDGELLIDVCSRDKMRVNNSYFSHKSQHNIQQ